MLAPHQTAHFNSDDLEDGAPEKGLAEGVGRPSEGDWRLEVTSELDINVLSYIRTDDGFVTSMHDVAPSAGSTQRVAFFNPGSNHAQQSLLRLVNPGTAAAATVTIHGLDDRGDAPGSAVRLSIPPGGARTLSAADLESGMVDVDGALGDGVGKWRLDVESDRPVLVLSLLATPTGHLTNLSDPTHDVDLTWVFAGDVSDDHKDLFRQEMKNVRSFFGRTLGVQATSFTVLVGENYDALDTAYKDAVGAPLADSPSQSRIRSTLENTSGGGLVATTSTRGAVLILLYGSAAASGSDRSESARNAIAHEYFHVLQIQLASGFARRLDGTLAGDYPSGKRVFWLVEGSAQFADFTYTPSSAGRRSFFDRYSPYQGLVWGSLVSDADFFEEYHLSNLEGPVAPAGTWNTYTYALGFAAVTYLVEQAGADSYSRYWSLLDDRETWQQAFEDAFGTGVTEFYRAFDEWLPLQLPSDFMVRLFIRWPDMDDLPQTIGRIRVRSTLAVGGYGYEAARPGRSDSVFQPLRYSGDLRDSASSLVDTYGLWWWDGEGCTEHLLGWYEDGELADQRDQATPIDLLDFDRRLDLDWSLAAHPSTRPRLESRTLSGCSNAGSDASLRQPERSSVLPSRTRTSRFPLKPPPGVGVDRPQSRAIAPVSN